MMQLIEDLRQCRECPLHRQGKVCLPVGMAKARVMVVGQAPGVEENRYGEPFVGQAGQFLTDCLISVGRFTGLRQSDFWYTNLVKHYPGRRNGGDDCPPFAIDACQHWLVEEYRLVQPELIVAVGAIVMRYFGVKGGIQQNAGFVAETEWGPVLPILHPAGLMRQLVNVPKFVTQLYAISTFLRGPVSPPPYQEV